MDSAAAPFIDAGPTSLEDLLAEFTAALEDEREKSWDAGKAICRAIAMNAASCDLSATAAEHQRARRVLLGHFASAGHCTINRVTQLAVVYAAFCGDGDRRAHDKPWSWHRALRNAAVRTERPVIDVLAQAIHEAWGQRELDALGKAPKGRVECRGHCGECDVDFHYVFRKPTDRALAGLHVACGFCAMTRTGAPFAGVLVLA